MGYNEKEPKAWRDMAPEEKGALLLASYEGKTIQIATCILDYNRMVWKDVSDNWYPRSTGSYRIKPEPKWETVTLTGGKFGWSFRQDWHTGEPTYKITFRLIDGKPDFNSIRMEEDT